MSYMLYVESNPPTALPKSTFDGEELAHALDELEEFAADNDLTSLSAFGRQIPDDFDGDPEEIDEVLGPWDEWFDPAEGVYVVDALIEGLTAGEEPAYRKDDSLVRELAGLKNDIATIQQQGAQFRLDIG